MDICCIYTRICIWYTSPFSSSRHALVSKQKNSMFVPSDAPSYPLSTHNTQLDMRCVQSVCLARTGILSPLAAGKSTIASAQGQIFSLPSAAAEATNRNIARCAHEQLHQQHLLMESETTGGRPTNVAELLLKCFPVNRKATMVGSHQLVRSPA